MPENCCGSGCKVCVWDIYFKELEEYLYPHFERGIAQRFMHVLRFQRFNKQEADKLKPIEPVKENALDSPDQAAVYSEKQQDYIAVKHDQQKSDSVDEEGGKQKKQAEKQLEQIKIESKEEGEKREIEKKKEKKKKGEEKYVQYMMPGEEESELMRNLYYGKYVS